VKTLKVEVKAEDVHQGKTCDGNWCPVALAFWRAVPRATRVNVQTKHITWWHNRRTWRFQLPRNVSRKISNFDIGVAIKPFEFVIPLKKVVRL